MADAAATNPPPSPDDTSTDGLSEAEATRRLAQYGENALAEHHVSVFERLAKFFWGPIPWMIEIAAILSAVLGHWGDLAVILAMLFINAGVGFWQEFKADNAIALLKQRLALVARTRRDGVWKDVEARLLVPGDLVLVKLGNVVPADIKLTGGDYLSVDQSALTGESLPVDKTTGDDAYSGSIARQGEMTGIVTATGMKTFFGKTAHLVEQASTVSHFQRAVLRIGNFLILSTVGLVLVIGLAALFRRDPLLETVQFALILTVASIPVALPAVLSVTMAIGAERLARLKAIVSRLVAIEEMAGMDVLCSDKTGTLTKNELTLGDLQPASGVEPADLLLAAALASRRDAPDAIDSAILAGEPAGKALDDYTVLSFTPFDPVSKRAEAEIDHDQTRFKVAKGAPQVIMDLCAPDKAERQAITELVDKDAARGFRTLGVARADDGKAWRFLGLVPLFDPPRDDCRDTIAKTESMGVDVKMVTGDHEAIAREIAGQVGLGRNIVVAETAFEKGEAPDIDRHRRRRRFRAGLSRAQVQDRQGAAERQPHRRHDRRRRQRRARPEAGRRRHRRQRRHRRRAGGGRPGADGARTVGDHHGHRGGPAHLRTHEQLRDLSHRRDDAPAAVHDRQHPDLQLLSRHRDHGRAAGAAQRPADHDDRLRQRADRRTAGALEHGTGADDRLGARRLRRDRELRHVLDRARLSGAIRTRGSGPDLPEAPGLRAYDDLPDAQHRTDLAASVAKLEAGGAGRSDPARWHAGRRVRLVHGADRMAARPDGLGLHPGVLLDRQPIKIGTYRLLDHHPGQLRHLARLESRID